jgi:hypothetical protein
MANPHTHIAAFLKVVRLTLGHVMCRPRERLHRPQTRRRRENNEDSLEKMKMIQANVHKGLDLFEMLVKRERKKRDLVVRGAGGQPVETCL